MQKIKNNPGFGGKKTKITFEKTFEKKIKSIKGGHIPPLPPCCARRACPEWLTSSNASLSIYGTTTSKNLVSQIAFGKRFANSWFVFAKLKFSDENFKTRPHLNFLRNLFLLRKNRKRFFWGGRAVSGAFTHDGRNTPRPPLKRGRLTHPLPLPSGGERQRQERNAKGKDKGILKKNSY